MFEGTGRGNATLVPLKKTSYGIPVNNQVLIVFMTNKNSTQAGTGQFSVRMVGSVYMWIEKPIFGFPPATVLATTVIISTFVCTFIIC